MFSAEDVILYPFTLKEIFEAHHFHIKIMVSVTRQTHKNQYFDQYLAKNVSLRMMLIPTGDFLMGSPENEVDRYDDESPQHKVSVNQFFLAKYPVTQLQWQAVQQLPQQNKPLTLPTEPSSDSHPIADVSWSDAKEFCDRLAAHTGRPYRLPTEAEWEYACRAGTTTPFHFGETISPELANYSSEEPYNNGPTGESPGARTPVGQYDSANRWGLSDMHGNVLEWCQDNWHGNYKGAPDDGSAWGNQDDELHVYRGGSWASDPWNCRSASRNDVDINFNVGFRVACSAPRT